MRVFILHPSFTKFSKIIFKETPHTKQVMMFTATLSGDIKLTCRKFMRNPTEVLIENESKLTLHGIPPNVPLCDMGCLSHIRRTSWCTPVSKSGASQASPWSTLLASINCLDIQGGADNMTRTR